MDSITEELFTTVLSRLKAQDEKIRSQELRIQKLEKNAAVTHQRPSWKASKAQLDYVESLGGTPNPEWTKDEVSKEIDRLKSEKENQAFEDKIIEQINEPDEVDSDNAGIDEEGLM